MTARAPYDQRNVVDSSVSESDASADQALRTYVLDTSVLLSDPRAFFRFAEHSVVIRSW